MKFRYQNANARTFTAEIFAVALSLGSIACGKESKKSNAPPIVVTPNTPEENNAVVVDDRGATAPVVKEPTPIASCKNDLCFELEAWSLDFGQTYVQASANGAVQTTQIDGFENPKLFANQKSCLRLTAEKLKAYAKANPDAMKPFADAKIATTFAARVYDSSAASNKVSPSLYFIKGSDGTKGGVSLARGKWVIRSSIKTSEAGNCEILNDDQIRSQLRYQQTQLIK
jgi:hypothetical protein